MIPCVHFCPCTLYFFTHLFRTGAQNLDPPTRCKSAPTTEQAKAQISSCNVISSPVCPKDSTREVASPIREGPLKSASNQEHIGDAMVNLQLRQIHRGANAAILSERISSDPSNKPDCGTRPPRNRTAKNTCAQSGAQGCRDGQSPTQANASRSECSHPDREHLLRPR